MRAKLGLAMIAVLILGAVIIALVGGGGKRSPTESEAVRESGHLPGVQQQSAPRDHDPTLDTILGEKPTAGATQEVSDASETTGPMPPPGADKPSSPPASVTVDKGRRRLAERLGLRSENATRATDLLRDYSVEELDLLARVQRETGSPPPDEVVELLRMRRNGAGYEELVRRADKLLASNLPARFAVRTWLDQQYSRGQPSAPTTQPGQGPSTRGRLVPVGPARPPPPNR